MRVIAGEAGGIPLVAPRGGATRPTSDLLKGAIFAVLGERGCRGRVLDLFAGSGALGIEALSRGADWCDFVDSSAPACAAIRANLAKTRLGDRATVHALPVERFLTRAATAPRDLYDLVLLDPPYALERLDGVLGAVAAAPLVGPQTALLLEHASRRAVPPAIGPLQAVRHRAHGDGAFTLYLAS